MKTVKFTSINEELRTRRSFTASAAARGSILVHWAPPWDFNYVILRSELKRIIEGKQKRLTDWHWPVRYERGSFCVGCQQFPMSLARKLLKLSDTTYKKRA